MATTAAATRGPAIPSHGASWRFLVRAFGLLLAPQVLDLELAAQQAARIVGDAAQPLLLRELSLGALRQRRGAARGAVLRGVARRGRERRAGVRVVLARVLLARERGLRVALRLLGFVGLGLRRLTRIGRVTLRGVGSLRRIVRLRR